MKLWLVLLLLPSLVFANPVFGPEIEFRGKRQLPALACGFTLYSEGRLIVATWGLFTVGFAGQAIKRRTDEEYDQVERAANYSLAGALGIGGITALCHYTQKISNRAYDTLLSERLTKLCADGQCELSRVQRKVWWDSKPFNDFRITYPDGSHFTFSHDPSVIEVNSSPVSAEVAEKNVARMQSDVFDLLKGIGLIPPVSDGPWNGGHMHVDVKKSFKSLTHLRNFLADLHEHTELGYGILLDDQIEGPSIGKDRGKRVRELVEALDELRMTSDLIDGEVMGLLEEHLPKNGYGLTYNRKHGTLEMRFLRSQKNAAELAKIFRLFDARIRMLEGKKPRRLKEEAPGRRSVAERLEAFRAYVEESGLKWESYREIAPTEKVMRNNDLRSYCTNFFGTFFK